MCETPESNQTSRMSVSAWKSAGAKPAQIGVGGKEVRGGPGVPGVAPLGAKDGGDVGEKLALLGGRIAPGVDA